MWCIRKLLSAHLKWLRKKLFSIEIVLVVKTDMAKKQTAFNVFITTTGAMLLSSWTFRPINYMQSVFARFFMPVNLVLNWVDCRTLHFIHVHELQNFRLSKAEVLKMQKLPFIHSIYFSGWFMNYNDNILQKKSKWKFLSTEEKKTSFLMKMKWDIQNFQSQFDEFSTEYQYT